MSKYQLWMRDEYGQGTILLTSEDVMDVIEEGKKKVTEANVQNALTMDDRDKNWEAYMVMVGSTQKGRKHRRYAYSGSNPRTVEDVLGVNKDGSTDAMTLQNVPQLILRIYLGNISTDRNKEVDWYAKDARKKMIESVDHDDLRDKTHYFIVKV